MFTKKTKYAIMIIKYLSINKKENFLSAKEVAGALKIPKESTAKIMQELARKKIISSKKGKGGGFHFPEINHNISLKRIIQNLSPKKHKSCLFNLSKIENEKCPFCDTWSEFYKKIFQQGKDYFN